MRRQLSNIAFVFSMDEIFRTSLMNSLDVLNMESCGLEELHLQAVRSILERRIHTALILIDLDGQTGDIADTVGKLRLGNLGIPIVTMGADKRELAEVLPISDVTLEKPFKLEHFLDEVRKVLVIPEILR